MRGTPGLHTHLYLTPAPPLSLALDVYVVRVCIFLFYLILLINSLSIFVVTDKQLVIKAEIDVLESVQWNVYRVARQANIFIHEDVQNRLDI